MLVDTQIIQYINKLPDHCVYGVIDDTQKTVYINYTGNFITKLRNLSQYSGEVRILSVVTDKIYKLIHSEYYALQYINKGYRIVNREVPFINLKPVVRVGTNRVLVYLSTGRRDKIIVGAFRKLQDAQEFKNKYYGDNWDGLPIYAINEETREICVAPVYKQVSGWRES